ncbi:hypothetical protein TKV_c21690 [Thermoanaerobacter kivui]|uniref:Uncharacterized protein n=1 Tax=Thermoanaerobacter kivui TaxID=2325 RepID=A0A097AU12_THEKI|nr:hypothetical protein [Thermoanaerobacter kivui]AIS53301.1 hypothetical protein TKV_c21690 [Thermoanaerobacter kivui]
MNEANFEPTLESTLNKIAFDIVNDKILEENEISKLLGVLSNDGVYAMWIYVLDKLKVKFHEDEKSLNEEKIFKLLSKIAEIDKFVLKTLDYDAVVKNISNLTKEINQLQKDINQLQGKIKNKSNSQEEKKQLENQKKAKEKDRNKELNKYFLDLSSNLNDLLFFKELFEKVLIYALYHAKAMGE